jgi:hypothetical protein
MRPGSRVASRNAMTLLNVASRGPRNGCCRGTRQLAYFSVYLPPVQQVSRSAHGAAGSGLPGSADTPGRAEPARPVPGRATPAGAVRRDGGPRCRGGGRCPGCRQRRAHPARRRAGQRVSSRRLECGPGRGRQLALTPRAFAKRRLGKRMASRALHGAPARRSGASSLVRVRGTAPGPKASADRCARARGAGARKRVSRAGSAPGGGWRSLRARSLGLALDPATQAGKTPGGDGSRQAGLGAG